MCTMEYYSATTEREILLSVTAFVSLEGVMFGEIHRTEKDKHCVISLKRGILRLIKGS